MRRQRNNGQGSGVNSWQAGGFEITGYAHDGPTAVKQALDLKPDLVLLDLGLPGFGGIEALKRIKAAAPEVRVLVLTIPDDHDTVSAALQAGADGYCLKPVFGSTDLNTAIESVTAGEGWLDRGITQHVLDLLKEKNR